MRISIADADVGTRLDLYSGRASCSSGVELLGHEVVVFGMSRSWSGLLAIDHAVMQDAIDFSAVSFSPPIISEPTRNGFPQTVGRPT